MRAVGRILMFVLAALMLMTCTVLQYHHHGESHVCMCFTPADHCHGHHHTGCEGATADGDCNHEDAGDCSLHLDSCVAAIESHADVVYAFAAVMAWEPAMEVVLSYEIVEWQPQHARARAGVWPERCLRAPPMC